MKAPKSPKKKKEASEVRQLSIVFSHRRSHPVRPLPPSRMPPRLNPPLLSLPLKPSLSLSPLPSRSLLRQKPSRRRTFSTDTHLHLTAYPFPHSETAPEAAPAEPAAETPAEEAKEEKVSCHIV